MDHRDFAISNDQFLTLIIRYRIKRNRCASDPLNLVCLEHSEDSAYCKFTAENFNWVVANYKFKWRYMEEDQVEFNWVVANYKFKWRYMEEDQVGFNWVVANYKFKWRYMVKDQVGFNWVVL